MYIQITNRCNMKCFHCCFSCGPIGQDMSLETFRECLDGGYDEYITIGGGEPTIHPQFEVFLLEAIAHKNIEGIFIVTNGKIKKRAMMLAQLGKKGVIGAQLSIDEYHEQIDIEVMNAFGEDNIRNTTKSQDPNPLGRARELFENPDDEGIEKECGCEDLFIIPSGEVKQCGCTNSPIIGSIQGGFERTESEWGGCYLQSYEYQEMIEYEYMRKEVSALTTKEENWEK